MELNEFISNFAEQFDETDPEEIKADTIFQDIEEWSSLTSMSIIAFVKMQYGKILTGKDIRSCKTVEDLYNIVANNG